jgi:hypothetical protein
VDWPGQEGGPWHIRKVGEKWYEEPEGGSPQTMEAEARSNLRLLDDFLADLSEITAKVRAGSLSQYQFAQEMFRWGQRLAAAGSQVVPGFQPPPRPGIQGHHTDFRAWFKTGPIWVTLAGPGVNRTDPALGGQETDSRSGGGQFRANRS